MRKLLLTLCCLLVVLFVKAQTTTTISSGTNVVNSGTTYNIPFGFFVNNGTYTDTTSGGAFNVTGGVSFSGSGTTLVYNLNFLSSGSNDLTSAAVSVYNTATIASGVSLNAGAGNLNLRTDILPHYATANLVNNGILTGTVAGLQTYATATTGPCATPYASTLSVNVSGSSMLYQWETSTNNSTWTPISGATNSTYAATVSSTLYYHCLLTSSTSAYSQATPGLQLKMTTPPAAIGGTLSLCMGGTTTLTDATAGGTWTSGSTSIANIGSVSGILTPVASGTVTVTYSNGCSPDATVVVTVNPIPTIGITGGGTPICVGGSGASLTATGGTTYSWTPGTGLSATTGATVTANPGSTTTYTVTGTSAGCSNTATIQVTVNALPVMTVTPTSQTVCNNANTTAILFTADSTSTYVWNNNNTSIGIGASGSGSSIASFTATNTGSVTATGVFTVTPTAGGCAGAVKTFTVNVSPTPVMSVTPTSQAACNNANTTTAVFTSSVSGTTYTWNNNNNTIGIGASGSGSSLVSFTATNSGTTPIAGVFTVTPTANSCVGPVKTFTITVNPTPIMTVTPTSQTVCNNANTTTQVFTSNVSGTTYTWNNSNTTIGIGASGSGSVIASFTATNTGATQTRGVFTVTPTANSCPGPVQTFTVNVNPTPIMSVTPTSQTVCAYQNTAVQAFTSNVAGTTYTWSNNNTSIGIGATGSGAAIASFTATNTGTSSISGVFTVTPTASSCVGPVQNFTIAVTSVPKIATVSPAVAAPSTAITITGTGFNTTSANNAVWFGATKGTVTAASATSLTVTAPAEATDQMVTVDNLGCNAIAYSSPLFLPTYAGVVLGTVHFNPKSDYAVGTTPSSSVLADLDGDGKADLITANYGSNTFSVLGNAGSTGTINFAAQQTFSTGASTGPISVSAADVDGDGKLDVVVLNKDNSSLSVYRNTTSTAGTFTFASASTISSLGYAPNKCAVADIDGDGKSDLVVIGQSDWIVRIYLNTGSVGSISFGSATILNSNVTTSCGGIVLADFDGDKKTDIAVTNYSTASFASVFRNTSTPNVLSFGSRVDVTVGTGNYRIAAADMDGDGKIDLAVSNNAAGTVSCVRNTSTGAGVISFAAAVTGTTGTAPTDIDFGDFNGDGLPDLAVTNSSSTGTNGVSVFRNTSTSGTISLATAVPQVTNNGPAGTSVGDLDGDGKADIAVVNTASGNVSAFLNVPNTPPTFTGGTPQSLVVCQNSTSTSINTLLQANDIDLSQVLTWTVTSAPTHGTLAGVASYTAATTGGNVTPTGMTYTPTSGYTGADAFTVQVSDGFSTASTVINVTTLPLPVLSTTGNSRCFGSSGVALTASGATTYAWTPSTALSATTGASVVSNPTVTTTYTVTGTTLGCSSSATVTLTVNPLPTVSVSPTGTAICIGSTSGAITASGAATYSWSPAIGLSATTGATVTSNTTSTRTYIVTGRTVFGCAGTANVTVTVNPLPTISASSSSGVAVCGGTPVTISASGGVTYSWSPSTGLAATTGSSLVATPSVTTTYTVTGTSALGCSNTAVVTVTINPSPALVAPGAAYCTGGFATLSVTGGTTYTWTPGTDLSATTGSAIIANPASTTTYTVSSTNSFGCTTAVPVTVTVNPYPVLTISPDVTICIGSPTLLTVSGATTYSWYPSTGLSTTTAASVLANPTTTQTYGVFGTTNGCSTGASVVVSVNPVPTGLSISGAATICQGGSTVLTASGASTYSWSPTSGLSLSTGSSVTASPTVTTTYSVTGTNGVGCNATASVLVSVNPLPAISAGPGVAICAGGSAVLTASGGITYSWVPSTGLSSATGASVTASPTVTTTYSLYGTDVNGCTNVTFVTVTVNALPGVSVSPGVAICASGSGTTLTASGAFSYSWTPSTGLSATTGASVTANPSSTTTYTVTGTSGSGCTSPATVTITVTPLPTVTSTTGNVTCPGVGSSVSATASTGAFINWYSLATGGSLLGSGGTLTIPSPTTTANYYAEAVTSGGSSSLSSGFLGNNGNQGIFFDINALNSITITSITDSMWAGPGGTAAIYYRSGTMVGNEGSSTGWTLLATGTVTGGSMNTQTFSSPLSLSPGTYGFALFFAGSTVVYTNGVTIGTVIASNSNLQIKTGEGSGPTFGSGLNPNRNPNIIINYSLSGASCVSASRSAATLTVNPSPAVAVGSVAAICSGGSASLSASGATTYSWAPSTGLSATTGATVSANPTVTTTYTVTGTSLGCNNTAVVTVTVNPIPTISGTAAGPICPGGSTALTASGGATYTWAPATNLSATTGTTVTASPTVTTTYTITGTTSAGCTSTGTVTVTVNPVPVVGASGSGPICAGSIAFISATGATTYSWSPGFGLTCSTCSSTTAFPGGTTTYTVTGTSGAGCVGTATVTVVVNPLPVVTTSGNVTICTGGSTTISASGATSYSWSPSTGLACSTCASTLASPTSTTSYIVTGTASGCSSNSGLTITVSPVPTIGAGPGAAYCAGGSTTLTATGASTYTWSPATALSATTGSSVTANPSSTTTYTITGTTSGGCVGTGTVTVTVNPLPSAITGLSGGSICVSGTASLSSLTSGGTWSSSNANASVGSTSGTLTGVSAGTATITYTLPTGCYTTLDVTVNALPIVNATGNSMCFGAGPVAISATGAVTYTWSPSGTLSASTGASVNANPSSSTTYTVTGTNAAGCSATATASVTVNPLPTIAAGGTVTICNGASTTLSASGGSSYSWSPATGLSATTGASVSASPTVTTTYTVTGTSSFGCTSTASKMVSVNPVPSAITGNTTLSTAITTKLSDVLSGGTWSSVNTAVGTINAVTGVVTGLSVGTSVISYNASGCVATTTVNVLAPTPGISLDGTNDNIKIADNAGIDISGPITIETWMYATNSTTSIQDVICKSSSSANTGYIFPRTDDAWGHMTSYLHIGGGWRVLTVPSPGLNAWHHCAMTYDGATIKIYTDGVLVGSMAQTGAIATNTNALLIGNQTGYSEYFGGKLDEVRIWNTALTQAQIQANMNCDVPQNTNLKAYYRFNEGTPSGTNTSLVYALDYSGNNNCGQLLNMNLSGGSSNYVTGSVGNCNTISISLPAATNSGTPTVCVGQTTTLSNTSIGGVWTSSNPATAFVGSATGVVTGVTAGTVNITYSLNCGLTVTTVTVNPRPIPTFTSGPSGTLCANVDVTYTTQSGGGITNYVWNVPGTAGVDYVITAGGIGTTSNTVTLHWITTGSHTVTVDYTDANGCNGLAPASSTTVVNPVPLPITGATTVCPGTTTSVSEATPSGTWSSADPSLASIGSGTGIITGVAAGTTTISYTLTATGCYATSPLTINPLPAIIAGASPLCVGFTETLTDASPGGTWTSASPAVATINPSTGLATAVAGGSATITYTLPTTCLVTVVLVVNPNPAAIGGTLSLCQGTTTTLTDATSFGTWSSSNTSVATIGSASGLLTAVTSGTTTVTYSLGTGCQATAVVTVNAIPTVAAITGTPTVCVGLNTSFSDVTPGGSWTSSTPSIASVNSTGLVTGVAAGSATITYTVTSGGCSNFATRSVTVNALPSAISGTTSLCVGASTTLTDAGGGTWTSGTPSVATIGTTTGVVNALTPGTTLITYTLPTGCTTTTTVTVNALPVVAGINGASNVCVGGTTTLTDPTPSGVWSSSNTSVASIGTGGVVTGVAAGTATITYTVTNGFGCVSFSTWAFTVNPVPSAIAGTTVVCVGGTIGLSDATPGGTWISGTPSVATINSSTGVVTGAIAGTTLITYQLPTGCGVSTTVTVNSVPTSITGTRNVCVGLTTALGSTPGGGTWSSSNTGEATVNTSGVVTGVAAGTPIITYSMGTGCFVTAAVTVNPLPSAISGVASACAGSSSTLTDVGGGTWSSGTPSVATIGSSTGVVSAAIAGTTVITYTLPTGCITTTIYTVNPMPTGITGTAAVCPGNTTPLGSTPGGGTWSSSNTTLATVSGTGVVTGVAAGMPSITYTLPAGCFVTIPVTVNPLPSAILGTTVVCSGSTTTLSDFGGGTWSSSAPSIAAIGATTGVVTGGVAGTATITYTLPTGCTTTTVVTVNPLPTTITGTPVVCAGLTTTLGSTPATGTWSSSNTGQATVSGTGVVTGVSAGTPIISYTLATGCYVTQPVTVNPLPAAIGGATSVCTGSIATLTDITAGGTWSSSNTSLATITSSTGIATGVAAGALTITYTLPTGCIMTTPFTVNPTPSAISGTANVCVGLTTTLGSSPAGGTWSSSNTAQATITGSGVVTGISAGNPIISYTLGTGCFTTTTLTVNALPAAITGVTSVCTGNTTSLASATPGGTWSSSNTSLATVTSTGLVTGVAAGNPTITYTLPTGCITTTIVNVNQTPSAFTGTLTVCQGLTTTLGSTPSGGTWTSSNSSEAAVGATSGIVSGVAVGTPTISYTTGAGCFNTAVVTVNTTPAAIGGPGTVCTGSTALMLDATTGGTWSSSNTAVAAIGSATGVVGGVTPGVVTITYTLPTGCNATKLFTVNPLPVAITGAGSVCPGSTLTLIDSTSGGTWSSSNIAEATIGSATGIVTGVAAGTPTMTYTLVAGCYATAQVTVNAAPNITVFTAPSATSQCIGLASTVSINSLSLGTATYTFTYTLSGANTGSGSVSVALTSGAGSFVIPATALTAAGTTSVTLTSVTNSLGCTKAITTSNVASFSVNPLPTVFTVAGGGSYCAGGTGLHVTLSGSTIGVNYQLMNGGTAVGSPVAGTASPLDFGVLTAAGTYSVTATNATTLCTNNMSGSATIVVNALPTAFAVTGGGSYCAGGAGLAVGLGGSQTGVNYQLFNGTVPVGTAVTGTGSAISFGLQTTAGTYTVVATDGTTTCTNGMTGSVSITVNPLPTAITGTTSICAGLSTTLGSTPSGGTWTSSAPSVAAIGSATGIITGGIAGTTTITYTLPTGCTVTTLFTVNPLPTTITGTTNVCIGNTTTLGSTPAGGTWSSSNPALGSVSGTGVVTGIAAGTVTITYSLGTGCQVTTAVTINPLPSAIVGIASVCIGSTTSLSDVTPGGTWTSSTTAQATVGSATGIVTGVAVGVPTITYTLPTGCIATAPVTVNPIPAAITGTFAICNGNSTTLGNTVTGGTWTSSNPGIATIGATSGTVTGVSAGVVTITYTLGTGCRVTAGFTVNALPAAITGPNNVCVGLTIGLANATPGGTWSSSATGVATVGASTGIVTGAGAGTATITYTVSGSCIAVYPITVNPVPAAITGTTAVCVGSSTTLASTTTGGVWSSSNTGEAVVAPSTGVVTGIAAGTPTITYTLSTGCLATKAITVNPLPLAITGITSVCTGSTVTLADATTGGTWTSSNIGIATVGSSTGVVTGLAAGNVSISYTLATGCSNNTTVTVNQTPVAISGSPIICIGTTATLTDATTGGTWSSSNTALATIGSATGVITGIAAGNPVISYVMPTGCFATMVASVSPSPAAIGGTFTICAGATTMLTDASAGGTWTSSNPAIASVGGSTGVVTGIAAGSVLITYTLPTGCFTTASFTVNPVPAAIGGSSTVCIGSTATATDATSGGSWSSSNLLMATIDPTTGVMTGIAVGTPTIFYTLPTGCQASAVITVNPLPAAISGFTSICVGATSTLSDATAGGAWSSSNPAIATIASLTGTMTGVAAGTVTITYTLPTGCIRTTTAVINPLPTVFTVTGGGSYCAGGAGVHVGLSGSTAGVNYQLYIGTAATGSPVAGTGAALDFGFITVNGTYTVVAINATTGCTANMSGSTTVTGLPSPTVFNLTGGGAYCAGGAGVHLFLSGSTLGVTYQLFNGTVPVAVLPGTGSPLDFGLFTLAGAYTAVATNTATLCTSNMTGSPVVVVNPLPTVFTVSGGGAYCAGGAGLHVILSGSTVGVNYQLFNTGALVATFAGTGASIDFGLITSTGTYTVVAVNPTTTCTIPMSGSATITVTSLPSSFSMTSTGSTTYCAGGTAPHIGLAGSAVGVNYQLFNGSVLVLTMPGTGSGLDFGTMSSAGTYTVVATVAATGCTANMPGSITVVVNPLPTVFTVTGGGTMCSGAAALAIGLSGSQTGVNYQLYNGTVATGGSIAGTGSAISFGTFSTAGTYSVIATSTAGCVNTMSGSAFVIVNPLPTLFTVTGGGGFCFGSAGPLVGLSGSQSGVLYQLSLTGTGAIGVPVAGTGSAINFGSQSVAGTYTIAATNSTTGCTATMTGSVVVSVNPVPTAYPLTVSGGGTFCAGGAGDSIGVANSQSGVSYQLFNGTTPSGTPVTGTTGAAITFGLRSTSGTYTVVATNITTGCTSTMTGSVTITPIGLPTVFSVTGGGEYCVTGSGVSVGLSGSTVGVSYQLFNGTTASGAAIAGTGSAISFGLRTAAGTYTVVATNTTTLCTNNMSGTAVIIINPLPTVYNVTGGGSYCTGGTGVHVGLDGSAIGTMYQLMNGTIPVGTPLSGTGAALDFGLLTSAGSYSVVATTTSTGCNATMTGSVSVSIISLPTAYTLTVGGGGSYCAGGSGLHLLLSGSQTGISYQLYVGGTAVGSPLSGTGSGLDFGLNTTAGAYSVIATSGSGCANIMTGTPSITINPLPTAYNVTGGGSICAGSAGVSIGLDGSTAGISYELRIGTVPVAIVSGTGSAITFGVYTAAGTYVVVATNGATSCTNNMNGSATIVVNPTPVVYAVTGGGSYCAGGAGNHIGLAGSTIGISYQLYRGTTVDGSPIIGTGIALDFGAKTAAGTYTVVATDLTTSCTSNMSGTSTITINPLPAVYAVSGGGTYCAGGTGFHVILSGSNTGVSYQLYRGTTPVGVALSGTGSGLDFGFQTVGGTYTVVATTTSTGCTTTMSGAAVITVNPAPVVFAITGGGGYCTGGTGVLVGLAGSQTGVTYQLYRGTSLIGAPVAGSGSAFNFGLETAGTYTVVATGAGGCTSSMSGSAVVAVNPPPTAYTVTGSGSFCTGGAGVAVGLSNSAVGVDYQLYRGTTAIGSTVSGTGSAISFGLQTVSGTYTVVANNTGTTCSNNMLGSAVITANPAPAAFTVTGGGNSCSGGTGFHIGLSGSAVGVTYYLYLGTTGIGSLAGTGAALDFGVNTTLGTYTVVGLGTLTGCSTTMTGSATIGLTAPLSLYTVSGGGTYCAGGTGFHVYLSGSSVGNNYQLYRGSTAVGSPVAGTGSSLDMGVQTIAGGYTVMAINPSTSCTRSMTGSATISVNPLPTAYTVTGGGSYCTGGFGLHIGISGSQTGVTYQLYRAGTVAVGSSVTGTGAALDFGLQSTAGTYTVVATNVATGCTSNMTGSVGITILPLPVAGTISGPSVVHNGATITLTSTGTGGAWSTTSTNVSVGATTGIVTGISAGAATVSYTVTNSCGAASATYAITEAGPAPAPSVAAIVGNSEICVGGTTDLTNSVAGGTWTTSTPNVATVDPENGKVSGVAAGVAVISYTVSNTGGSTTVSMPVMVDAVADSVIILAKPGVAIAAGQRVSLTAAVNNGSPAKAYQWTINNVPVKGATSATYVSSGFADNDVVACNITGQCSGAVITNSVKITLSTNAVEQTPIVAEIRVVPNPNNGIFVIKGSTGTTADDMVTVEVTDVIGQVVYSGKIKATNGELNERIQLGKNIANGMYLLNVNTDSMHKVFHLVVEQ